MASLFLQSINCSKSCHPYTYFHTSTMTSLNSCFCFSWCVIVVVFGSILQNIQPQVTYQIILTFLLLPVAAVAPSIFFSLTKTQEEGGRMGAASFGSCFKMFLKHFKVYKKNCEDSNVSCCLNFT